MAITASKLLASLPMLSPEEVSKRNEECLQHLNEALATCLVKPLKEAFAGLTAKLLQPIVEINEMRPTLSPSFAHSFVPRPTTQIIYYPVFIPVYEDPGLN